MKRLVCFLIVVTLIFSQVGVFAFDVDNLSEFTFSYSSMLSYGNGTAKCYYDDSYFSEDSSIYNPHLATMSLCLEIAAWPAAYSSGWDTDIYSDTSPVRNGRNLLIGTGKNGDTGLGFDGFAVNSAWVTDSTENSFGVMCAKKSIKATEGDATLIALALRGGGYDKEWASNVALGKEGAHEGFEDAKNITLDFLSDYIESNEIKGNVKIWLVGYSRGGAVANLVAGAMDNGYKFPNEVIIDKNDLYAYTFESPSAVQLNDVKGDYSNIHNIVNLNDLVPVIVPRAWGFTQYNDNIYLPAKYTTPDFESKQAMMFKYLSKLKGGPSPSNPYSIYKVQETCTQPDLKIDLSKITSGLDQIYWWEPAERSSAEVLREFIDYISTDVIKSRAEYATELQDGAKEIMLDLRYNGGDGVIEDFIYSVIDKVSEDDLIELLSPIWAINLDSKEERLNKVRANVIKFVNNLVDSYDLPLSDAFINYLTNIAVDALLDAAEDCLSNNTDKINLILKAFNLIQSESAIQAHYPEITLAWLMSLDSCYNEALSGY